MCRRRVQNASAKPSSLDTWTITLRTTRGAPIDSKSFAQDSQSLFTFSGVTCDVQMNANRPRSLSSTQHYPIATTTTHWRDSRPYYRSSFHTSAIDQQLHLHLPNSHRCYQQQRRRHSWLSLRSTSNLNTGPAPPTRKTTASRNQQVDEEEESSSEEESEDDDDDDESEDDDDDE